MHRPQGGESWCLNLVGGGVKEEKGGGGCWFYRVGVYGKSIMISDIIT